MTEEEENIHRDLARERKAVKLAALLFHAQIDPDEAQEKDTKWPGEFRRACAVKAQTTPPSDVAWARALEILKMFSRTMTYEQAASWADSTRRS